jgi:methionyl-tRNA formyltransferase
MTAASVRPVLRTVFMGTPEIAVPSLRLLARRTAVSCVVTQPDRPAGRGHHLTSSPVKRAAEELCLPLWQPETLKGHAEDSRLACDLAVVMAYGELLRQDVLDRPSGGCVNLHASLLPRWRGASPLQAALRAGDERTGVTVMRMVRALDAGPIYLTEEIPIDPAMTLPALHDRIAETAACALDRFLAEWPALVPVPQEETHATFCRKLTSADGHLDFTRSGSEIERWVRAYTPSPGCWATMDGQRLRILALEPRPTRLEPGEVVRIGDEILAGCSDGAVAMTRLQPAGGRIMSALEFLNGHRLGARLA